MAETIKGGAYQGSDGTWTDANGKPLSKIQLEQLRQLQAEQEAQEPTPAVVPPPYGATVTAVTPVEQAQVASPKRSRKSKGSK